MIRRWLVIGFVLALLVTLIPVSAHSLPVKIDPPPNIALDQAPPQIRVWFSEPVEPDFSNLSLRDANGNILPSAPSTVNPNDPTEIDLIPGALPDGVYTVVWRALSSSDGHATLGSFPLVIGSSTASSAEATQGSDAIPVDGTLIRWTNLLSLAIGVGGLGFFLFVWKLAMPQGNSDAERRQYRVIWFGWVLIGITGFLLLLLQYEQATGSPFLTGINSDSLNSLVSDTRFGHLWLARMALWAGLGGALWFGRTDSWFNGIALVLGLVMLAINSLFSHADAAHDVVASVAADWLHLVAAAIWVGGLIQFINVIGVLRRDKEASTPMLGRLVGYFSNFARVSVIALVITGLYAFWLQVGSWDALFTTRYGQSLVLKGILLLPVIGIAAINLIFTHKGLEEGKAVWGGRLRGLVGAEIALTSGILLMVGVMTSISPGRTTLDQRLANPPDPTPTPFTDTQTANDLTVQLSFTPGWIGNNDFTLKVTDSSGKPVNDASLIRMRFESLTKNLGQNELRPTLTGDGIYTVSGANLSVPGDWRIRTTIQRSNQYDTLVDFTPNVPDAPEPPPVVQPPDPGSPLPYRVTALLLSGVAALAVGGFFLGENRTRPLRASTVLSVGLLLTGILFLASAMEGSPATETASAASPAPLVFQPAPNAPIRLTVASSVDLPYLITADGKFLQADSNGQWKAMALNATVRDAYADEDRTIWAATDSGLYSYKQGQWSQVATDPVSSVTSMHGYVFALGVGNTITRVPEGGIELEPIRELKAPQADQKANEIVMLGNHSHILQNGTQLYLSDDLGLSWQPVSANAPVDSISTDVDGNLLATQDNGLAAWNYTTNSWSSTMPLPGGDTHPTFQTFDNRLYAVGNGALYVQQGNAWHPISLPNSENAYLDSLAYQYPKALWVLDSQGSRLWSSEDGEKWTMTPITVSS